MKPADFTYHRPTAVDEATEMLSRLDDAKVLGGGQSLLPIMNMRLAAPAHLVDITGIADLRWFTESETAIRYGATTTHMMIEDQLVPDASGGLMPFAAAGIGYRAVRNRGTIAGSLAHADSSAEWPTIMTALNATVEAVSIRGRRRFPVRELLRGFFTTALQDDEFIAGVEVPRLSPNIRWGLYKMARKPGEFAESLAVALIGEEDIEIWLGAARDVPVRLTHAEEVARSSTGAVALPDLIDAIESDTGTEGHDRQLHAVAVQRAVNAARRDTVDV
jgi:carbon-monoxide dehydrogenase medium subunit